MGISLRRARVEDKANVLQVEALSTPNLRYLGAVFEHWVHDQVGELIIAELGNRVVGVGKLTVVPDGSAWLEALRVIPEAQGQGVGKSFYQRFFEIAARQHIPAMRMYTGIRNVTSKGLAERFGFHLAATYRGASLAVPAAANGETLPTGFKQITDAVDATNLLLSLKQQWNGFLVMNRTFYALTPELCAAWTAEGKIYHEPTGNSLLALGARFQADRALQVACLSGDLQRCLAFAAQRARQYSVPKLQCLFPPQATELEQTLVQHKYQLDSSDYIVMEVSL